MTIDKTGGQPFHDGDEIMLAKGTYEGTLGVFRHLKDDPKWADIMESDGSIRSHPVEWIAFRSAPAPKPVGPNL